MKQPAASRIRPLVKFQLTAVAWGFEWMDTEAEGDRPYTRTMSNAREVILFLQDHFGVPAARRVLKKYGSILGGEYLPKGGDR